MRRTIVSLAATAWMAVAMADVESPDGKIVVSVVATDGQPQYSVVYDGRTVIEPSPLGLLTNIGDYTRGLTLHGATPTETLDTVYECKNTKQSVVHYVAHRATYSFYRGIRRVFDMEFRVSDRDVAFRYTLYPQRDTICCAIDNEQTGFRLPAGSTSIACPQAKPMEAWRRTSPSYETPYMTEPIGGNGTGEGYTFPCLFHTASGDWVLISETGVTSAYCGSRLIGHTDGLYTIGFPDEGEMDSCGSSSPGIHLPGTTPWRTITIGNTLAPIVETTVMFDLVSPLYAPSREYVYGAGAWSWIIGKDESVNLDEQRRYIDFAADMGWQSVLIDNFWDTQIGRQGIEQLAHYAQSRGVALFLWYNSNGYWNDAPQTPRDKMNNLIARHEEMKWLRSIGIRGIKVDFMGSDKQKAMQLFEEILADANEYGLLVIFHGCTLPRGWERMYPNFVASEAVLASENLSFEQHFCDDEALCATIHPFVRNTVASMDFGGSALNHYYNTSNTATQKGTHRVTSDVFALATAVLFQSACQHFALAPNNLIDAPSWAIDFMKTVPTTWDEVRYIDGTPGEYVVLARRHGNDWYVAGVNATERTLKTTLSLPMVEDMAVTLYSDDPHLVGSVRETKLDRHHSISVEIPTNGGVVIVGHSE